MGNLADQRDTASTDNRGRPRGPACATVEHTLAGDDGDSAVHVEREGENGRSAHLKRRRYLAVSLGDQVESEWGGCGLVVGWGERVGEYGML
jgi:hypothetical protein